MLKKLRMNVRAALGSEAGRKGRRKKGMSSAVSNLQQRAFWIVLFGSPYLLTLFHVCTISKALEPPLALLSSSSMHHPKAAWVEEQAQCHWFA